MKNEITQETATQYLYDYGLEKAAEMLNITPEKLEELVEGIANKVWNKPSLNKNAKVKYINPYISEYIEQNYSSLHTEFVKNTTHNVFYQSDEDVFHNALIKVCADLSKPTEEQLHKAFDKAFRTIKWENRTRSYQMKSKEILSDFLEFDNEYEED